MTVYNILSYFEKFKRKGLGDYEVFITDPSFEELSEIDSITIDEENEEIHIVKE